jgi:hypothetical protein
MSLLIFALILILIVALAVYAIDLVPFDARLKVVAKVIVLIIAIIVLCQRAGMV